MVGAVRHPHFMYSAATQRAVSAWLAPERHGVWLASPGQLHSAEVIRLLWSRHPALASLLYRAEGPGDRQAACSRCSQCFRIAVGNRCRRAATRSAFGIDVPTGAGRQCGVLAAQELAPPPPMPCPDDRVRAHFVRGDHPFGVRNAPLARVLAVEVGRGGPRRADEAPDTGATLAGYQRLSPPTGVMRRSLSGLPGRLSAAFRRGRARQGRARREIFASHFPPEPETSYADQLAHCEALTRWVVAPWPRNATRAG